MIGDVDPIKAARSGRELGDELTMHYGLLPRANRGIFAINELPDLASKVQVGLFNILQEGDVQIKGYPVRLRLDVALVFSANPEDYTARGKIITPLKDRIGSEIRTHYPRTRGEAMAITAQEAWVDAREAGTSAAAGATCPAFVREIVEEVAFQARGDQKVDKRSGVSQRLPITALENVVSNAERRALDNGEAGRRAARERHLRLAAVAHRQDRARVRRRAEGRRTRRARARPAGRRDGVRRPRRACRHAAGHRLVRARRHDRPVRHVVGRGAARGRRRGSTASTAWSRRARRRRPATPKPVRAAVADFVLEGLCALKKISRTEDGQLLAHAGASAPRERADERTLEQLMEEDETPVEGQEEVLQLSELRFATEDVTRHCMGCQDWGSTWYVDLKALHLQALDHRSQIALTLMKYRYSRFVADLLERDRPRVARLAAVRSAARRAGSTTRGIRRATTTGRCRRCTTRFSTRC